jgi:hypothetical protein
MKDGRAMAARQQSVAFCHRYHNYWALIATHVLGCLDCAVFLEYLTRQPGAGRANLDALEYRKD